MSLPKIAHSSCEGVGVQRTRGEIAQIGKDAHGLAVPVRVPQVDLPLDLFPEVRFLAGEPVQLRLPFSLLRFELLLL